MPIDQYAGARRFFPANPPAGLTTEDGGRIMAYDVYEAMYWSVPDAYRIVPRSQDAAPIYLPSARSMIEATQRFLAVDWDFLVNPKVGTTGDQDAVKVLFQNLFKRERVYTKFVSQKRNGLIRGDAMWHVTADPNKPLGERVSLHELHPGQYFPIYEEDNRDRIVGCYLVDEVTDPRDDTKLVSRRQMYRRDPETGRITSELALYELGKWDDRVKDDDVTKVNDLLPAAELPPQIKTIPVYHIKNYATALQFGSSQIRGVETVFAAINQTISDQDLAISMQGLGVYWTTAGPPKDNEGNDAQFVMGPGEVVEVPPGETFGRVSGITGALPGIEHMKFMIDAVNEATGVADVARGRADVSVAESGIALYLQMAPLLSQNGEKEVEILGVYDNLFFDLVRQWFPAYEALTADLQVEVTSVVGDPMPKNREAQIKEIMDLRAAKLITVEQAQKKLGELGYEFEPGDAAKLEAEEAAATADPFADRLEEETGEEEV